VSKPTVPLTPLCLKMGVLYFWRNSMAYVYGHYKADTGELFYIGKGTGKRAWGLDGRNPYWNNVVNKHGIEIKILYDNLTEEAAYEKEKEIIAEVGLNNLTNIAEGGQGITSELAKELAANRWSSDEYRKKHLESMRKRSENGWSEKLKELYKTNIELYRTISERNKKQSQDPEWRRKVTEANQQTAQDPEWRRKQKEGAQKNTENINRNKKISEKVKSYWDNNPDDDRNKKLAQDPEWRNKVAKKNKEMSQDPEWRRKQREGIKLYWENKRKPKQSES